jgi:hypothetical protein
MPLGALYWFAIWSAISFPIISCPLRSGSLGGSELRYTMGRSPFEPRFDQTNC